MDLRVILGIYTGRPDRVGLERWQCRIIVELENFGFGYALDAAEVLGGEAGGCARAFAYLTRKDSLSAGKNR